MANESQDFITASPKRIRLDIGDNATSSNLESAVESIGGVIPSDERRFEGGSSESPFQLEEEDKHFFPDLDNYGSDKDDNDDVSSTVSNLSDVSITSDKSGQQWKPVTISFNCLEKLMMKGVNPRIVLNKMTGESTDLPESISDLALWRVIFSYISEPPKRNPLPNIHSLDHVVKLINDSSKIMVLTGAGVSVSCGIPDFRSKDGVYARLAIDFPNLPDPQAMFDINFFMMDPRPFFKFAKEIYPGQFQPSPSHRFIKMIERHKKLLRNYTQNIDTLERVAGIENVIECHGSFATATCTVCHYKASSEDIKDTIFQQRIPYCPKCGETAESEKEKGIMKPDIVFFGEGLPDLFHDSMAIDKDQCDLLIVIGSSLKVRPVALIPSSIPPKVPQILINRERLPYMNFDVELLGDSDVIIDHLCRKLGGDWSEICWRSTPLTDCSQPEMESYTSDSDSSEDEDEDGETQRESGVSSAEEEGPQSIKCQKIAKRQTGGTVGPEESGGRHTSLDSSRDSGIGENSNNSSDRCPSPSSAEPASSRLPPPPPPPPISSVPSSSSRPPASPCLHIPRDLGNSFFCLRKRRYVFPGAEIPELCPSGQSSVCASPEKTLRGDEITPQ